MADSISYSSITEDIVEGSLAEIPYVGHILSDLVPTLWPGEDNQVWEEMESQVQALIEQDINQLVYNTVLGNLTGFKSDMNDYLDAVNNGGNISDNWTSALYVFDEQLPNFQIPGSEVLLLPLWAQAVNLYLSLLRDGVLFGVSWGWTSDYQQSIAAKLSAAIPPFVAYGKQYFQQGVDQIIAKTAKNDDDCQPFRSVNAFVRQMTFSVSDYGELWPFFDPTHFPNPIAVHLGREIYSDPVGSCTDSGNIVLPLGPAKPPNQITVWAWDRIDAVQSKYPSGQGPGAETTTPRMGDTDGGSNQPPHGGVFDVQNNPVVVANGSAGTILNKFNFTFKDGTTSGKLGGSDNTGGGGTGFSFSYDGHILSSIHINGISNYYGSADCAVFGFKYAEPEPAAGVDIFEIPFGWTTTS
jgi:hypothetical protein